MTRQKDIVRLDKLSPEKRERVEQALLGPRDTSVSLKFRESDVEMWKEFAEDAGESLTETIERAMSLLTGEK